MAQENDPRQVVIFSHNGGVTVVDVACLVTERSGGAEFGIVARLLLRGGHSGLGRSSAAGTLGGQAKETLKFAGTCLFVDVLYLGAVKRRWSICLKLHTKFENLLKLSDLE